MACVEVLADVPGDVLGQPGTTAPGPAPQRSQLHRPRARRGLNSLVTLTSSPTTKPRWEPQNCADAKVSRFAAESGIVPGDEGCGSGV